ncbi:Protein-L-isoaspartate O-methyltransferase [Streptomyces sp. 2224.1]|uniref:protein-L-isoaspartate(D-aspartate) O-methyltransferase n=1 Tax=unclassified Streptomyces TaxID=2593676 RepID=UPI00088B16BA|nr:MULTISPECIES: protein-L-isoaspartate(D-aspartate) O-methyltransferase [unclassified Streptomyces]PBC86063.1 protein-L-isoaspartate O-methyltransferase [Streptomyces sp. 2321.6]SDQ97296.1 Protein-L-isoaspartate O-methyltransferase [Streptomyces sp. KS_16]SED82694.1 Protein-L-isoaspartate O-methyltransferase [Streptomyces sp. 2112.3]SED87396.1 Protein-L-isoaspartate O-methyltransferase [Streptomyces sp. 2133.1]SEE01923.1 Protein-L-isoaspartate O-methyltransferase [Streptomyces sp. 2224.1]
MTTDAPQERPGLDGLGRALMASGALSSDWAPSYAAVPRSTVLPDLMWPFDMAVGRSVAVSKADDPTRWLEFADSDVPIVTQWDDGKHTGTGPGQVPTSSASMPSVVFRMLQDLDLRPGHKALEIGTATAWNALLMAHRAGPGCVTTVEVDRAVATAAMATVERLGIPLHVVHGDGFQGYLDGAPYDRVIATCGLRSTPPAWLEQCRPGGVIVAPWGTNFSHADAVARLVVAPDGKSAAGNFTGPVEFMKLRSQRLSPVVHKEYVTGSVADGDESSTTVTEAEFVGDRFGPERFALGLRVPRCRQVVAAKDDGARPVWFYGLSDRSWACCMFRDGKTARVWQSGPRRLWDEAEAAFRWWEGQGRPAPSRFGLTVTARGERVWLDDPANSWTL